VRITTQIAVGYGVFAAVMANLRFMQVNSCISASSAAKLVGPVS
jgi:hypothetical protein